jgi:predicted unusual protein kinase regulating ubiquinone biosynthesis (AarF/ABC1/UbiB family)
VSGHFHADPHPGNIFVVLHSDENPRTPADAKARNRRSEEREALTELSRTEALAIREATTPARPEDPKLAMVDFGMTSHLTRTMRDQIVRLLLTMADGRGDETAEVLIQIGDTTEDFDRESYVRQISAIVAQHADQVVADVPAGLILYEMISIGYSTGLRLPAELTLLAKALFNLDAVTRALDANFNPSETIREYASTIATRRAREDLSPRRIFEVASATSDLIQALPRRIDSITERMARNDFSFRVDAPQLPAMLEGMQKIANRVLIGLIIAGLLISSGLLLRYYQILGLVGLILAGGIGLYVLINVLVTDRRATKTDRTRG